MPTDEELDALAAYQLALGRQEDFNLPSLELKSALASNGKTLFLDTGNLPNPATRIATAVTLMLAARPDVVQLADAWIPAYGRQSARFQHGYCDECERDAGWRWHSACRATVASGLS